MTMRERTRRLAQAELTVIAQDLFVKHGYEETTVEQIAAAAGMSKRTFFRYFASKDDLVIGKYDLLGDQMAEALRSRPEDEPVWDSMRRLFDSVLGYVDDPVLRARNDAMEHIVHSTLSLRAGYLEKLSRMQGMLVEEVARRLALARPSTTTVNNTVRADPRAAAIVGAAFACLTAARATFHDTDQSRSFSELLDEAMDTFNIQ
jgi:AcrR family transcriptional regulator